MPVKRIKFQVGDISQTHADAVLFWQDPKGKIDRKIGQKLAKEWRIELPAPITTNVGEVYTMTARNSIRSNNGNPTNLIFYGIVDTSSDVFLQTVRKVLAQLALITQAHPTLRDIAIPLDDRRFRLSDLEAICGFLVSNFLLYANPDCVLELYVSDLTMAEHLKELMDKDRKADPKNVRSQLINRFIDGKNREEFLARKFFLIRGFARTDLKFLTPSLSLLAQEDAGKSDPIFRVAPVGSFVFKTSSIVMEDYLVVVAFGQIIANDNGRIEVVWLSQGFHAAIKNRNYPVQSMYEIFVQYEKEDIYELIVKDFRELETETSQIEEFKYNTSRDKTVEVVNDIDVGEDYLAIAEDVNAFARIVALRSFRPPLAIALCGKWGSGKSFFMEKMIQRIDGLIEEDHQHLFCKGVAHIRFNAWSYLDSNLWAGMVTKIFGGLNEYINQDDAKEDVKNRLREALEKQISLTKEHALKMAEEKSLLEASLEKLQHEKKDADDRLKKEIEKLNAQSFSDFITTANQQFDVTNQIEMALKDNKSVIEVKDYVRKHFPKELWDGNGWGLKELSKIYAFMLDFFSRKRLGVNIPVLSLIILMIWVLPELIADKVAIIRDFYFKFPPETLTKFAFWGMVLGKAVASYKRVAPIFSALWKIRRKHSQRFEEAKAQWEQKQKEIEATIHKEQTELANLDERLGAVEIELAGVEFRLANRLGSEAFAGFINHKSRSDDYRKHQGLIATIRDDFETLSNLFDHYATERPTWKAKGDLDRPLERIVLYIDDLDRCSEERVVEVLQAVHLVMAFRLFVVVVGIDPSRVKSALDKTLPLDEARRGKGIAFEYLEKIFQIPFHLKKPTDEIAKAMLEKLLSGRTVKTGTFITDPLPKTYEVQKDNTTMNEEVGAEKQDHNRSIQSDERQLPILVTLEDLVLSDEEIKRCMDFSFLVGTSPRTLKRFANTYRVVRAHGNLVYSEAEDLELHHDVVMFLLALSMGPFRDYYSEFSRFIDSESLGDIVDHLRITIPEDAHYKEKRALFGFIQQDKMLTLFDAPKKLFAFHNELIKRFSFAAVDEL